MVFWETPNTSKFDAILAAERVTLEERRKRQIPPRAKIEAEIPPNSDQSIATGFAVYNTTGLSLSGGGIRSAAFSLGVLQALNENPGLGKIDYLSTVSGGGYMGAALTASMATMKNFIFASPSDYRDSPAVGHLRNYSNYLLPRGETWSFSRALAVVLRGLMVNLVVVCTFAFGAALFVSLLYPERHDLLSGGILGELVYRLLGGTVKVWPMLLTQALTAGLCVLFVFWAIRRSRSKKLAPDAEVNGPVVKLAGALLVAWAIVAMLELQPVLIAWLFTFHESGDVLSKSVVWLKGAAPVLAPLTGAVGFFSNRLAAFLKATRQSRSASTITARLGAKVLIWFAALAIPIMIWLFVLFLAKAAIRNDAKNAVSYPHWQWLISLTSAKSPSGHYDAVVIAAYAAIFALLLLVSLQFSPNANSLHRLYRDRLSKAFLFKLTKDGDEPLDGFPLSAASPPDGGPYHIINAALNVQGSKTVNRRGRNADFFFFSSKFVGSESTGYAETQAMEDADPQLNLGTAMAISGAAVSSDMGSESIKVLSPTLALLNVRLGYWMTNPKFVGGEKDKGAKPDRKFRNSDRLYLALEMFGELDENQRKIYLTDGGHIENLGTYQLLKRGCKVIIAVDAEADEGMTFQALSNLERYARIDLGIRIDLPWQEIAARSKCVDNGILAGEAVSPSRGPHCAVGRIHYPNGVDGYLLYIKASMSGDESDYVLDYKRRNPSFPHETTSDQFFSEEQFEAYRSLAFHAMTGALTQRDLVACIEPNDLEQCIAAL